MSYTVLVDGLVVPLHRESTRRPPAYYVDDLILLVLQRAGHPLLTQARQLRPPDLLSALQARVPGHLRLVFGHCVQVYANLHGLLRQEVELPVDDGFAFFQHRVTFEQCLAESLVLAVSVVLDRREQVERVLAFLAV